MRLERAPNQLIRLPWFEIYLFIYLLVRGYQAHTPIQKYSAEDL